MTFSDRLSGLLLIALGLAVAGHARTFPPMPGQDIGPSLFPTIVGVGIFEPSARWNGASFVSAFENGICQSDLK